MKRVFTLLYQHRYSGDGAIFSILISAIHSKLLHGIRSRKVRGAKARDSGCISHASVSGIVHADSIQREVVAAPVIASRNAWIVSGRSILLGQV